MLWNWWLFQTSATLSVSPPGADSDELQTNIWWHYNSLQDFNQRFEHFCLFNASFFWQEASLDTKRVKTKEVWSVCWSLRVYVMSGCRQKGAAWEKYGASCLMPMLWMLPLSIQTVDYGQVLLLLPPFQDPSVRKLVDRRSNTRSIQRQTHTSGPCLFVSGIKILVTISLFIFETLVI